MNAVRIRSVTIGADPEARPFETFGGRLKEFHDRAAQAFTGVNMDVQTWRLVLPPARPAPNFSRFTLGNRLDALQRVATSVGIRWMCQPFHCSDGWPKDELAASALEVIKRHSNVFVHFIVGENGQIFWEPLNTVGEIILSASRLSKNGFDNFRVGAGCNIRPNTPFFPFSYHEGADGFSLAVEIIGLMAEIAEQHPDESITQLRDKWVKALVDVCRTVGEAADEISAKTGWEFKGMDISLAPYPGRERSVAKLVENLGPRHVGQGGTLSVTAILTDTLHAALRESGVKAAGFNGVMYSVMEDDGLAASNNARHLTLDKLLCFSSVCGCGIDMVPLAGTVFPEEIANIILDTSSMAMCLNKPLGVRVLPIPMKESNEMTDFNHDFLVNTRIFGAGGDRFRRAVGPKPHLNYITRGR